jgi:hypothetical protein
MVFGWVYRVFFPNHEHAWGALKLYEWRSNGVKSFTTKRICMKCNEINYYDFKK